MLSIRVRWKARQSINAESHHEFNHVFNQVPGSGQAHRSSSWAIQAAPYSSTTRVTYAREKGDFAVALMASIDDELSQVILFHISRRRAVNRKIELS
jgi:hypothetical protein